MNFLAHIFLSGNDNALKIGNFIADGIRGKSYKSFPVNIQYGILLHRAIDSFTDSHNVFRKSTKRLHPYYSHYSGVIVDIFYDHFLAKNWKNYSDIPLEIYVNDFYTLISSEINHLPEKFKTLIPAMIKYNWLYNYRSIEGIQNVLNGMNRRTDGKSNMHKATKELKLFYEDFENEFSIFFEDIQAYTKNEIIKIKTNQNTN